jgi:FG-GAP-like repeat
MPSLINRTIEKLRRCAPALVVALESLALACALFGWTPRVAAQGSDEIPFYKHTIDLGISEAAEVADVNRDGKLDIISGDNWFEQTTPGPNGPRWIKHHFRDLLFTGGYLEDLGDLAIDVNGDGYPDVVTSSYWSAPLAWWENPGKSHKPWLKHVIATGSPVEFSFLVDILNTGKPRQLLPQFGSSKFPLTWYEIVGKGEDAHWVGHIVSPRSYGHGIGAGDVNADGRTDIITPKGWFEAPPDPRNGEWTFHSYVSAESGHAEFDLGETGFIYTMDVNGDGLPDLVTTLGHSYGIFWYEQKKDEQGNSTWAKHLIDNAWSQAHALTIADLQGNGKPVLVTGKRYYAHEHDPGANEPLGVYWYEKVQTGSTIQWRRHIIDYSSRAGGGIQVAVVDIDHDGDLDVIVGGKSGLFFFENMTKGRKVPLTDVIATEGK